MRSIKTATGLKIGPVFQANMPKMRYTYYKTCRTSLPSYSCILNQGLFLRCDTIHACVLKYYMYKALIDDKTTISGF